MHIRACADLYHAVTAAPPSLKEAMAAAGAQSLRRASRFMQLALLGAMRCASAHSPPAHTAIYLASGRGDLEISADVLEQVFRHGSPPKPLSFVNTVSNAACFYIAKHFSLAGRSSFVCHPYLAFENTLQLALADLAAGHVETALVGSVDVILPPQDAHRRRIGVDPETPLGEGTHWLYLSRTPAEHDLGRVIEARHFASLDVVCDWIAMQLRDGACAIGFGCWMTPAAIATIMQSVRAPLFEYRAQRAHYDTQSAAAVHAFVRVGDKPRLLHVNADPQGRYAVFVVDRGDGG